MLFLSTTEGLWGGSEVLWSEAALVLRHRGMRVGAFFPYYKDIEPTRRLAAAGVELFFGTPPPVRWWRRIGRPKLDRPAHFLAALQRFAPALVVCNQGATRDGLAEMAACRERQVPCAMVVQAVEPLLYGDFTWHQLRTAYGSARKIWCVSSENLADLQRYLAGPLPNAEIIPNAYACPFNVTSPWPENGTVLRLAMVARLEPEQKAQDLILEVMALDHWRNRAVHVTCFGDGAARESLETRARQLALRNVTFAGQAPVGQIWRHHHALLLPSRYEGQSLAMIEAMLHGRPVIATPVGGTAGVVIDGRTGFLAETSGEAHALDRVLERAWNHRAEWPEMGRAAGEHIRRVVWPEPGREFADRLMALMPASP